MALRPYRRKAQFYETDGMGIIYHGNYIHWMEEARLDMLEQLGWPYEKVRAEGRTGHFFWDMARQRPVALKRAEPALYALLAELAGEERRGGDPWTGRK